MHLQYSERVLPAATRTWWSWSLSGGRGFPCGWHSLSGSWWRLRWWLSESWALETERSRATVTYILSGVQKLQLIKRQNVLNWQHIWKIIGSFSFANETASKCVTFVENDVFYSWVKKKQLQFIVINLQCIFPNYSNIRVEQYRYQCRVSASHS